MPKFQSPLIFFSALLVTLSCSTAAKKGADGQPLAAAAVAKEGVETTGIVAPGPGLAPIENSEKEPVPTSFFKDGHWEKEIIEQSAGAYEKMIFDFKNAEVRLSKAGKAPRQKKGAPKLLGKIEAKLVKGDDRCKLQVNDQSSSFEVADQATIEDESMFRKISGIFKGGSSSVPSTTNCEYQVDITMFDAIPAEFTLKKSNLFVENWDKPLAIEMNWGTIDLQSVRGFNVNCGECDLTGEKIAGPVKFNVVSGNVGLSGLTGSVDGVTSGDTVLKWEKLATDSSVKLISRNGDVILTFPKGARLSLNLKVPRGEVYSKNEKLTEEKGVPVSITAEAGNVKLYR